MAFLFGLVQVILAAKNKSANFYFGIVSVVLYIYVFYTYGLFAESLLNAYYLLISIGGIYFWQASKLKDISTIQIRDWVMLSICMLIVWIVLYVILKMCTPSTVPAFDAFVSAAAWIGSWLLMKRKLENWIFLNISNVVAIPLQLYKGLSLTALLTMIYFIVAIKGYIDWKRRMEN
ncbi:MAG: nicotinamide mononucleotide transporter [Bacteroidetes bacterium]|nr:nicotinamide mononucleotide transporter [Bacteroidota bacterium]